MSKVATKNHGRRLMNSSSANPSRPPAGPVGRRAAVLALFFFLFGIALTAAWFEYGKNGLPGRRAAGLSGDTLDLLRHLNSPVQLQFYSVLPPGSTPQSIQDFSLRVEYLLSEFQNANPAKIQVVTNISPSNANADAAAASGLRPFNRENGGVCFLGITVACGGQTESLAQLQPAWERALPYDLARAILRVIAEAPPPVIVKSVPVTPAMTNELLRLIPDIHATSLEDADRIFRQDFVDQCTKAGAEMEAQINTAAREAARAQTGGSAAELETARKHLLQVQLEQADKLKEIAAHLQLQMAAFQQMKAASTNAPK
jgi:hypothetical protein